jgi:ADP-heptose:LPS heptosyltransferase
MGQDFTDFADTAAAIALLDLVIAVDTSVAHLAGAMGKGVALLIPFSPDFRWLLARTDSPWYPTMRIFRQSRIGDWDAPVAQLRDELASAAARLRPEPTARG